MDNSSTPSTTKEPSFALYSRIISGSVGALVTSLAVTPLEVVKVRQQAASTCPDCGNFVLNNGLMECVVSKESVPYFRPGGPTASQKLVAQNSAPGTFRLLRNIFAKEGLSGIYAGLAPTLVMSVPSMVLYFTAYDEIVLRLRRIPSFRSNPTIDHIFIPLVGGSTARVLATTVTSPLELIRTQRALHHDSRPLLSEMRSVIRNGGVSSLYKGLAPTLWRDAPFSAIYWLSLEHFKRTLSKMPAFGGDPEGEPELSAFVASGHAFLGGMMAGTIAAAFTTPFDVVKTRTQMVLMNVDTPKTCDHGGALEYRMSSGGSAGVFAQMREIVKVEGVEGLWRGNQTRMIKVAPACAIMISCYELGKRVLG